MTFGSYDYNASTTTKTINVEPKPVSQTNITDTNITVGDTTTLTATFYDDDDQIVPDGMAIFKVNGKTLRYDNGSVIYVPVTNGQATLPDVTITQEWMKEGTTIQAVYCGSDDIAPIFTEATSINITQPKATITITSNLEAKAGDTITLTANVTDGDKAINSGRVVFKLNGKTLKDESGKALYANVTNGVATASYTLPAKTKAKTYNLTTVFTDSATRQESNSLFLIKSV